MSCVRKAASWILKSSWLRELEEKLTLMRKRCSPPSSANVSRWSLHPLSLLCMGLCMAAAAQVGLAAATSWQHQESLGAAKGCHAFSARVDLVRILASQTEFVTHQQHMAEERISFECDVASWSFCVALTRRALESDGKRRSPVVTWTSVALRWKNSLSPAERFLVLRQEMKEKLCTVVMTPDCNEYRLLQDRTFLPLDASVRSRDGIQWSGTLLLGCEDESSSNSDWLSTSQQRKSCILRLRSPRDSKTSFKPARNALHISRACSR